MSKRKVFDRVQALEKQDLQVFKRKKGDAKRGLAAQSQNQIHQRLVECRILLQRSIESPDPFADGVQQCDDILAKLTEARRSLLCKTNEEDGAKESMEEQLAREYTECRNGWKEVLDRRHKDARLHAGSTQKFRVLDASFFEQVESVVQYETARNQQRSGNDAAAFEDSKVYQQMLKDFLSKSSSESKGQLSIVASKGKTKATTKVVDRKASKGRKIRYAEIPKLVNFTFPIARPQTELETDTWLRSLFGGVINEANKK